MGSLGPPSNDTFATDIRIPPDDTHEPDADPAPFGALVPCPICGQPGVLDRPELGILQATCTACAWHYTPRMHATGRLALLLTLERAAREWRDSPDELARLELCSAIDALRAPVTITFVREG